MSRAARDAAVVTGELPHEFLLRVSRGGPIIELVAREGVYEAVQRPPTFSERVDAAKAAAPFYAPKLANVAAQVETGVSAEFAAFVRRIQESNRGLPLVKHRRR